MKTSSPSMVMVTPSGPGTASASASATALAFPLNLGPSAPMLAATRTLRSFRGASYGMNTANRCPLCFSCAFKS
ncbi:MAG: hypothetical protein A4E39_00114 [Methanoregulaceae archaeon PtaB.Bin152]|nr:MAG: hypothetical protein A4E39_00114 [Methanoregulaceae archaeon PtaB.Bin152]